MPVRTQEMKEEWNVEEQSYEQEKKEEDECGGYFKLNDDKQQNN
jgi:hypothetical protein